MRRQSRKRRERMDAVRDDRQAYLFAHGNKCIWCDSTWNVAVHEIARGMNRNAALSEPSCWLPLCGPCNCGPFHNRAIWPDAKQMALKYLRDNVNYDLVRFNYIVNPRAPNRVTQDEVDFYVKELISGRIC